MKLRPGIRMATLALVFGAIAPAYTQRDQQDEKQNKSERQQSKRPPQGAQQPQQQRQQDVRGKQTQQSQQHQDAHEQRQQDVHGQQRQQPQQDAHRQQEQPQRQHDMRGQQRTQEQARAWQQQKGWLQQGGWQGHSSWQQNRARHWENEHRTWGQRDGYGGYYIPEDRFRIYFGSAHLFRIHSRPTIFMGYPRFEYGGFSFMLVDPWPEYWAEDWYDTDDLYIDYNDGYYLHNPRHSGAGLAITVVLQ
jgi:hypothetical protein